MKSVFLVDDNQQLSAYLDTHLTEAGYTVTTAFSGLAAIKALSEQQPDIIAIDYFLPGINGDKLCSIIRKLEHLKGAYLIMMSAAASELKFELPSIGADALVAKGPFRETYEYLLSAIQNTEAASPDKKPDKIIGLDSASPRQLTRELVAQYRHVQAILDSISEGIIEVCDGQIVYVNPAAETIFHQPQNQLLATYPIDLFGESNRLTMDSLLSPGSGESALSERQVKRHEQTLSVRKLVLPNDPTTYILRVTDITDQIKAEEILLSNQSQLESLVEERTAELQHTHEKLYQAQKMQSLGLMASGIAHDFNNILTIILGNAEVASYEVKDESPPHQNIAEIKKACERAQELTKQILAFCRQTSQEPEPFLIDAVVLESLNLIRSVLPSTIEIKKTVPENIGMMMGEPAQISRILFNLYANANHAMREEGGILSITLEKAHFEGRGPINMQDVTASDYIKLTISDTGGGIPHDHLDKIFDPYFTTKVAGEGTGMGLAVVHGIVKQHNGAISVDSKVGKGTTFEILFPAIDGVPAAKDVITEATPQGNESILFVDDEPTVAEVYQNILSSLGYTICAKTSSLEALRAFKSQPNKYDLIITDQTMPHMTGQALANEMMAIRPDIPIILCTGYSDLINKEKAKEMGIRNFVMKPVAMNKMARIIREALKPAS